MRQSANLANRLKRRCRPLTDRARRGVAAIEFALIMPAMVLLMFGVTELSLVLLCQHLLENATYNASRTSKTGYVASGKTQLETVMEVLLARLSGLNPLLDPSRLTVTSVVYSDLSEIGQPMQGAAGIGTASQIVVYTVTYPWQTFTPLIGQLIGDVNGVVNLSSRIVVRNEPYD